jgi:hypothetical protein
MVVDSGFFGRKFACNSKNSQIGVRERLIKCKQKKSLRV